MAVPNRNELLRGRSQPLRSLRVMGRGRQALGALRPCNDRTYSEERVAGAGMGQGRDFFLFRAALTDAGGR